MTDGYLNFDTKINTSGFTSGLKKLAGALAIGATVKAAVKAGMSFESAFAGVRKTVDATAEQLAGLKQGIRDMAKELPTSANEIAGVAEAAGQLGIETDNILGFTKTMTMLGDATNLTAEQAATTLARFANITGMSQDNFDRLGSSVVALGNNFATTEAEIADMAQNIASAGSQVGMSEPEIMGFAAALSSVGMEAAAGGTAISRLVKDMQLAVETGSEDLQQFANVAGMSADEFSKAFRDNAADAVTKFFTGLNDTERLGKSAIAVLDDMGISEVRLSDAILRAAGSGDLFKKALETSKKAWEDNTALTKEAEQRYETLESQLGILKNHLIDLGISFYDGIQEPLKKAASSAIDSLSSLTKSIQNGSLQDAVAGIGEAFGAITGTIANLASIVLHPFISTLGAIGSTFGELIPVVLSAGAAFKTVTTVQGITESLGGFSNTLKKLIPLLVSNPWALAAAGVAGLSVGIYELTKVTDKNAESVNKLCKEAENQIQSWEDSKKARAEALNSQLQEIDNTQWLADELASLVDENGRVEEANRSRAQYIIDELSSALGIEIQMIDGIVDGYQNVQDEIQNTILKKQAMAIMEEQEAAASEARKGLTENLLKIAELEGEKAVLEAEKASELRTKIDEGWSEQMVLENGYFDSQNKQIAELDSRIEKLKNSAEDKSKTMQEFVETSAAVTEGNTEKMKKIVADQELLNAELTSKTEQTNLQLLQGHASLYTDLIQEAANGQREWNDSTLTAAASLAQSLFDKAQEAGANLPAGLIKGIDELKEMPKDELEAYCKEILDILLTGLEEHSPSKATERNGVWLIEGLLNGMTNSIESVFSAISNFCDTIKNNFSSFLSAETLLENGRNLISGIASGISSSAGHAISSATAFCSKAINTFSSYLNINTLFSAGSNTIQGLINGIKSMASAALSAISSVVSPLAETARNILKINSPSKVFRDQVGKSIPEGLALGIENNAKMAALAVEKMSKNTISTAKKAIDSHSPSKVFENQVGKTIPQGVAVGIKENTYEVTDAVKQMFDDIKLQKELGAISEGEYYEKLREYRDQYLEESTKEWWDYTKELISYEEKLRDRQFKNLDWFHDNSIISDSLYYQMLADLRDQYFSESDEEWQDYTEKILNHQMDLINDTKDSLKDALEEAQNAFDDAVADGAEKMREFSPSLLKIKSDDGNGNITEYYRPNDYSYRKYSDEYYNSMMNMQGLIGMLEPGTEEYEAGLKIYAGLAAEDPQEAVKQIQTYLNMGLDDFINHIKQTTKIWREDDSRGADIYGFIPGLELEKAEDDMEQFEKEWLDAFGTLPDQSYNIGVDMMQSIINGALSQIENFKSQVVDGMLSVFNGASIGINASAASPAAASAGGGNTYIINSPGSTIGESIRALKDQDTINRLRGY